MNLPKPHKIMNWLVFATVFCIVSIGGLVPVSAFNPQPEPPRYIMPTLTPDDSLRVNIAYVGKKLDEPARCVIIIRALLDGALLIKEKITLESRKGSSKDYSYDDFLQSANYDPRQLDENEDFPLRVHIKATSSEKIFVGLEIHGLITHTDVYIPVGAVPIE